MSARKDMCGCVYMLGKGEDLGKKKKIAMMGSKRQISSVFSAKFQAGAV